MSCFILVHGSWHSAWNWHKVVPILEKAGHLAIAIDLPGMGRDKTPIEQVTMDVSVNKLVDTIQQQEGRVILVGHSKNGVIVSQAAEIVPNKLEALIYLAAYLIPNGKTQAEYSALDTEGVLKPYVVRYPDTRSHTLSPEIYREGLYHDCDPDIAEMAKYILSHEPMATGTTALSLSPQRYGSVPRYYIECTEDRAVTPFIQRKMYEETSCNRVFSMKTSHSPFFSAPEELCRIFMEIEEMSALK